MTKAGRVFFLFLSLNILNYLDRYVTSGILPLLKTNFHASDALLGSLGTAFMITYATTALPFGAWSDKWKPHKVAAIGVAIWSVSTILSAFAWSFSSLFAFRALVGIGEAAYVATGSTILSGAFPQDKRSRILGWFNIGLPIGGSLGVVLGGIIGTAYGWNWAFALVGIPGLFLSYFTWKLPLGTQSNQSNRPRLVWQETRLLWRNPTYLFTCFGYAGVAFAFGALVLFASSFFHRYFGYSLSKSDMVVSIIQVTAGLIGAPMGGYVADIWMKRNPRGRAYTLVLAMMSSAVFLYIGLHWHNLPSFFVSVFFMMWHIGVASAMVFDVTPKHIWNTASAISLLIMHLFGDVPSSTIVGMISDRTSLMTAFLLLPIPMLLAAVFFLGAAFSMTNRSNAREAI